MVQFLDLETERKLLFLGPEIKKNGSARSLGPETDEMVQFLDPETDIKLLFLGPEIVKMVQQYHGQFAYEDGAHAARIALCKCRGSTTQRFDCPQGGIDSSHLTVKTGSGIAEA